MTKELAGAVPQSAVLSSRQANRAIIAAMSAAEMEPVSGEAIRLVWPGVDALPIHMANQFLMQVDSVGARPDQMIFTIGQVAPPAVLGTAEERLRAVEALGNEISVTPLARYSVTPARLEELIETLQRIQKVFTGDPQGPLEPEKGESE